MNYTFRISNIIVIDGDTLDADIDLGFCVWLHKQRIRLYGIDAPETRTKDLYEKARGKAATEWLINKLHTDEAITLVSKEFERGKFGRILGTIMVGNVSMNRLMLSLDLVKEYE